MESHNVKAEAYKQLDTLNENILGIIQIGVDDRGLVSVCVGGFPDVIIRTLANTIKENHQIRDLFETALFKSNELSINLN